MPRKRKSSMTVPANVRSAEISAVKITADGRRIPLGVISTYHRNPVVNLWRQLLIRMRRALSGV